MPHLVQPRPILRAASGLGLAQVDSVAAAHKEELAARLVRVAVKLQQHIEVEAQLLAPAVRAKQPRCTLALPPTDLGEAGEAGRGALHLAAELRQLRRAPGWRYWRHVRELTGQHRREHHRRRS